MFNSIFILSFLLVCFAVGNPLRAILEREGFVVEVRGNEVIIDLGEGKVRKGEVFEVIEPFRKVVHPWTGEVLGTEYRVKGKILIEDVENNFSYGRIIEGDVKKGDRIRISIRDICYEGSEEGYFEIGIGLRNVKRGKDCRYIIKELRTGFGFEFNGMPLYFFKEENKKVSTVQQKDQMQEKSRDISKVEIKTRLIGTFSDIPLSADIGNIYGDGKDYIAVLFEDRLDIFEVHKNEITKKDSLFLPAGYPAFVKIAKINPADNRDYILLNMVEGGKAKSYIIKMVKEEPVFVVKNLPFFINVLNKRNPEDTFVGQRVELPKWGKLLKLKLEDKEVKSLGEFLEGEKFPIDGALYHKDMLIYIDREGMLNIFKDDIRIFRGTLNLRNSYNYVKFGEDEEDKEIFFFSNPLILLKINKYYVILSPVNEKTKASEFFNIPLFRKSNLYFAVLKEDSVVFKKVEAEGLNQSVQALLITKGGELLIITAFKGSLGISRGGNIHKAFISATFD